MQRIWGSFFFLIEAKMKQAVGRLTSSAPDGLQLCSF